MIKWSCDRTEGYTWALEPMTIPHPYFLWPRPKAPVTHLKETTSKDTPGACPYHVYRGHTSVWTSKSQAIYCTLYDAGDTSPTRVSYNGLISRSPALFCWKTSEVMKMSTWTTWIWAPQLQNFLRWIVVLEVRDDNPLSKSHHSHIFSASSWVGSGKNLFSSARSL